jgi:TPP-dependent pyruvate/acetoin dehydrogenase alpha subunit
LFVCKDNQWEITTKGETVTGGNLTDRARGFGMPAVDVDGSDVEAVWAAAELAIQRARLGEGPTFLHASCVHLQGHFLGDQLLRLASQPLDGLSSTTLPMVKAFLRRRGAPVKERLRGVSRVLGMVSQAPTTRLVKDRDPLVSIRLKLVSSPERLQELEEDVLKEIQSTVERALTPESGREEGS